MSKFVASKKKITEIPMFGFEGKQIGTYKDKPENVVVLNALQSKARVPRFLRTKYGYI